MKKQTNFSSILLLCPILLFICLPFILKSQTPKHNLVGYLHNWQVSNAPYVQLDEVDARYDIIDVAFAEPKLGTSYNMQFVPNQVFKATFISQIQTVQAQGRKVLISMGGANAPVSMHNIAERDTFIASMNNIIETYGFDGMDIDFEGNSLSLSGGTIANPVDEPIKNLIYAVKKIMSDYYLQHQHRLILTMAPETAFVQGGQSAYNGIWGAYLPVIDALRDSIEILHVQLYNSGSMYGIDGKIYFQGTADFIVAECEAVIQGFNTAGGMYKGLPANKIAVGLPACTIAAGGGYTETIAVKAALDYLLGNGPQPGAYKLANPSGYPDFRGMMTWSINWDAVATCGNVYSYAQNFTNIFGTTTSILAKNLSEKGFTIYPNPTTDNIHIQFANPNDSVFKLSIFNNLGIMAFSQTIVSEDEMIDISKLPSGMYYLVCNHFTQKIIKM